MYTGEPLTATIYTISQKQAAEVEAWLISQRGCTVAAADLLSRFPFLNETELAQQDWQRVTVNITAPLDDISAATRMLWFTSGDTCAKLLDDKYKSWR